MPLTKDQQDQLARRLFKVLGCPGEVDDCLRAYRLGIASALAELSRFVSLDSQAEPSNTNTGE